VRGSPRAGTTPTQLANAWVAPHAGTLPPLSKRRATHPEATTTRPGEPCQVEMRRQPGTTVPYTVTECAANARPGWKHWGSAADDDEGPAFAVTGTAPAAASLAPRAPRRTVPAREVRLPQPPALQSG